ncbi:MAG: RNA polymerase sigma factor RpoH [Pseudomonadota bacterium]
MSDCKDLQPIAVTVPGVNLGSYIQSVSRVAVLTADEERALAERLHFHDDLDAARQLVLAHLRFVVHIAKSYSGYGLPQADLIQEGNIGLMKAVKRFDPTMGVRLVSFAVHWIKAEIHEYVIKNWRIVKVATTKAQRKLFFNLRSMKKSSRGLTQAEAAAIAEDLNVSTRDVFEMEGRLLSHDTALEGSIDDDDEKAAKAPIHYLEDHRYDPALLVEADDTESRNTDNLMAAIHALDTRSQAILARRWLSEEKATLHELADEFGVSAERIRQLEKNAMDKVRAALTA